MAWIISIKLRKGRKGSIFFQAKKSPAVQRRRSWKLTWDAAQFGGEYAEIDTNVQLEELFVIMQAHCFEPFLHNLSSLVLNGVEIDAESFKNFVIWHAECGKLSPNKNR
jgi:hypothetical protein